MRRIVVVGLLACLAVIAMQGLSWASAGEFEEARTAVDGVRTVMWAVIVMVLVGGMVVALLKVGGREWIDALKAAGVVVVLCVIVGVVFNRVLTPIISQASAATLEDLNQPAMEYVMEEDEF